MEDVIIKIIATVLILPILLCILITPYLWLQSARMKLYKSFKKIKLPISSPGYLIKNAFLFGSFSKREYNKEFNKICEYEKIKDKKLLKILNSNRRLSRFYFFIFNFYLVVIIILFLVIAAILFIKK